MLRTVVCFVAFTLPSLAGAQPAPARDTPRPTGTSVIRGRVLAGDTDQPLRRAVVTAASAADQRHDWNVLSDANGRFEIKGLPGGAFFIAATKQNYIRVVLGQSRVGGPGKPIDVAAGQILTDVIVRLPHTAVITGHVVDEFDEPVSQVQIAVLRYQTVQNARRLMPAGRQANTDESGNYRLFGLQPGDYYVSASFRNFAMMGSSDDQTAYAPTYFPGTPIAGQAQKITIAAGQTLNELNFTLQPARASKISGTAMDSKGQPLANTRVSLTNPPGVAAGSMSSAMVKADGSFTIGGVAPGDYILRASVSGGAETAAVPVRATGDDITGLEIVTWPQSVIKGSVVFAGDSTHPSSLRIQAIAVGDVPGGASAEMKADGTFEMKIQAGRVLLRPAIGGTWRLRSVRVGGATGIDVSDTGIDLPANTTLDAVRIELTDVVTQVTGTVTNAAGEKTRDAIVLFFSADPDRWGFQSRYFFTGAPTPATMTYTTRVAAGDYLVVALPGDSDRSRVNDPEFLQQIRDRAVAFTIAEGEKKTIDLRVTEAAVQ